MRFLSTRKPHIYRLASVWLLTVHPAPLTQYEPECRSLFEVHIGGLRLFDPLEIG